MVRKHKIRGFWACGLSLDPPSLPAGAEASDLADVKEEEEEVMLSMPPLSEEAASDQFGLRNREIWDCQFGSQIAKVGFPPGSSPTPRAQERRSVGRRPHITGFPPYRHPKRAPSL